MSAIWGIINTDGKTIAKELGENIVEKLSIYKLDSIRLFSKKNVLLGCGMQYITPESIDEVLPYYDEEKGLAITADAIIDNRKELVSMLNIEANTYGYITDSQIILKAYEKWGEQCPKYLVGDFAFAIWNEKTKEMFCARDPVGKRSFYFSFNNNIFAFGTVIRSLLALEGKRMELNEAWITDFLYLEGPLSEISGDKTIYKDIYQLLPAHTLIVRGNKLNSTRYWDPLSLPEIRFKSDMEYEEAFREIFFEAVRCRLRSNGDVGVMLSGGLDSSSVACVAARELGIKGKSLKAYSLIPFSGYKDYLPKNLIADEREYIESIKETVKNIDTSYMSSDGSNILKELGYFLELVECPYKVFRNISWIDKITKSSANNGCSVLLDGQFGNLSISYGEYSTHIVSLFRKARFMRLSKEIYGYSRFNNISISDSIKISSKMILPDNIIKIIRPKNRTNIRYEPVIPIREELIGKHKVRERLEDEYYNPSKRYDLAEVRKLMMSPMQFTQIGMIETKQSLIHGIARRDPTRDRRVLEFCMSIPGEQYVRNGQDRYLIRRAMEGIIPEKIRLNYTRRGRQAADWIQLLQPQWQDVKLEFGSLYNDGILENYVDMNKLKEIELKVGNNPNEKNEYLVKVLVTALILKKFFDISSNN